MVTTLYLIRHGETEGSEIKRYKGSIDVPLSERGIAQIRSASVFINSSKLSAVYCSPLSRALKSAEIIAEPHGLNPLIMHGLRERSFGVWEGMLFDEIKKQYPDEFKAWADNPLRFSPVGGENTLEVRDRALQSLDKILKKHNGESISIVAHGGVNRVILCDIMGIPFENLFRIEQDFAAVNVIEFWDTYPVVKGLNLTRHNEYF